MNAAGGSASRGGLNTIAQAIDLSAGVDQALNMPVDSAGDDAKSFLRYHLAAGVMLALDVQAAAKAEGISSISLRRAKKALGILSRKAGMADEWHWILPSDTKMVKRIEDDHSPQVLIFAAKAHSSGPRLKEPLQTTPLAIREGNRVGSVHNDEECNP